MTTTMTITKRKRKIFRLSIDNWCYAASRQKEVNGLFERCVFQITTKRDAAGMRIFGSRFVACVKNEGTPGAFEKTHLVIQGFQDKLDILTNSPTVRQASLRILLTISVSDEELSIILRDVKQAYVQSDDNLQRLIFIRPPAILGYPSDVLFKVVRPLYVISEAGISWFCTYHKYHKDKLSMHPSVYNPCYMYTNACLAISRCITDCARGIVCLQTDDIIYTCNREFIKLEENKTTKFDSKPTVELLDGFKLKFN